MPDRHDILRTARDYLGTPWRHQGRLKGHGMDCAGLIICVAAELELFDCRIRTYRRQADGNTLEAACREFLDPIPLAAVRPGDILMLDDHQRYPCHLALVGDRGQPFSLIHAVAGYRQVVEHRFSVEWLDQYRQAFSFRGLAAWEGPWPL
jgi:hypothetical protein